MLGDPTRPPGASAHAPWHATIVDDRDPGYIETASHDRAVRRWLVACTLSSIAMLALAASLPTMATSGLGADWRPAITALALVIALPYLVLLLTGRLRPAMRVPLANLPLLVTLQAAIGERVFAPHQSAITSPDPALTSAYVALALAILVVAAWNATRIPARTSGNAGQRLGGEAVAHGT